MAPASCSVAAGHAPARERTTQHARQDAEKPRVAVDTHPSDVKSSAVAARVAREATRLGDLLLRMTQISPKHQKTQEPACSQRLRVSGGHSMLVVTVSCVLAMRAALMLDLPLRLQQFIGGILLVASAGTMYLLLCYLLSTNERTFLIGDLLLDRSNPLTWNHDRLRYFLEVCSWMASVWCSYAVFHSLLFSILGGALAAVGLAVFSDFCAAYIRVVKERMNKHRRQALKQVAWVKGGLSYLCVGYVITGNWRNLYGFLSGERGELQSIEDLVFGYLLITLVGVSLIVASELLLLYEPTRNAGITLQSRIVDARRNWEERTWRSMLESTAVFGTTMVSYHVTQDILTSLQLGTLVGVALILVGDALSSRFIMFSRRPDAIPSDHWIKLVPVGVMMFWFAIQVGSVLVNLVTLPSSVGFTLVWIVTISAISLTIIALSDNQSVIGRLASIGRELGGRLCMLSVTGIAFLVCHGWPAIAFSTLLSWFCISLSRECWNEIEAREARRAQQGRTGSDATEHHKIPVVMEGDDIESPSWSSFVIGHVRRKYSYLYKRVKWTFIPIVVLSVLDVCSTIFVMSKNNTLELKLSQFSAGNVVVSTGVGYLTSNIRRELHPEVLVKTGVQHYKNKWILFPLHAFIEAMVFLAVFCGTFAATSTVFSSITLASLSGIVISVGGHWVCSRLNLSVGNRTRIQLTASCAIVFCLFLVAWVSLVCLFSIYHYIDNLEAAFCLASLAGVLFLATSELFLLWEPTREIGHILQCRVTHAKENWMAEPLRSFLEVFTWLAVICGTFALYDDLLLALQLGTFSGIALALSGEFYRRNRSKLIPWEDGMNLAPSSDTDGFMSKELDQNAERPRVLPAMLLFAYIGSGTFQWIYENIRSLEVTVVLATFAGFVFLCVADLLVQYRPTRWAGIILQDRFLRARENWHENPVRSFVELGCFLGVIYGSYAIYGDLVVAVQLGTVSGMLVALFGERLRSRARSLPLAGEDDLNDKNQILPLPVMSLLGLVGAVAFNIIYTHLRSLEVAFVLATTSGVAFAVLGDVFVRWKPTRKVGLILQERILYIQYNLKVHPQRTWIELLSLTAALYASYGFLWPKDLLVAMQFGTFTGIFTCVCDELTMEYIADFEQNVVQGASRRRASHAQPNSDLLALPYEIQFEIAHFLSPEDLLVARATCHKINNMLRAESARYWLYSSLRRKFRNLQQVQTETRVADQVRSLVYDAITLVLPRIFIARDRTEILASGSGLSRTLKWVYLNAEWIRSQGLVPLAERHHIPTITFQPGDAGFDVFRHMPDKAFLNITVERDESMLIKQISVPVGVYAKIQADPLSFVAAETLSELDAFSNWHIAFVVFSAMTLIFIGQFSSVAIREHMLPKWF
ncbi:hypothetical protein Poli38472_000857 [Pythium oligandrum]|uniref:F-box domain-containing protein n=1 Tax=Pythium oligandrum TaxID=41045 RepID=A0A8K1CDJ1_PYTOL|nr:hypothetical protein Poli38472_000857 [Pythium oligandrum]|eukprot:TMW60815.1 hypothetical protein Poli38472_000857 [Pythium oligandrum]